MTIEYIDGGIYSIDGGSQTLDGGTMFIDGGPILVDGGHPVIDGGARYLDGGVAFIDGGVAYIDGGEALIDGGETFVDGGVAFIDGGEASIDGGLRPIDGGEQAIDGGPRGVDSGIPAPPWVRRISGTTQDLLGVTWSGSLAAAVGFGGTILRSGDGVSWSPASPTLPSNNDYYAVTYGLVGGNGTLVAVGTNMRGTASGGIISTSSDGQLWVARTPAIASGLTGVAYGNGTFVAVGNTGAIEWSVDAVNWTAATGASSHLDGVAYLHGRFVVIGQQGAILTSPDGQTWMSTTGGGSGQFFRPTFAFGRYMAPGGASGSAAVLASVGLTNWVVLPISVPSQLRNVGFNGTELIATCADGLYGSTDGTSWSLVQAANGLGGDVIWANHQFIAVGSGGRIYTR